MARLPARIVALLLLPSLVMDPVSATVLPLAPSSSLAASKLPFFDQQAINPPYSGAQFFNPLGKFSKVVVAMILGGLWIQQGSAQNSPGLGNGVPLASSVEVDHSRARVLRAANDVSHFMTDKTLARMLRSLTAEDIDFDSSRPSSLLWISNDTRKIIVNPELLKDVNNEELVSCLAHETAHQSPPALALRAQAADLVKLLNQNRLHPSSPTYTQAIKSFFIVSIDDEVKAYEVQLEVWERQARLREMDLRQYLESLAVHTKSKFMQTNYLQILTMIGENGRWDVKKLRSTLLFGIHTFTADHYRALIRSAIAEEPASANDAVKEAAESGIPVPLLNDRGFQKWVSTWLNSPPVLAEQLRKLASEDADHAPLGPGAHHESGWEWRPILLKRIGIDKKISEFENDVLFNELANLSKIKAPEALLLFTAWIHGLNYPSKVSDRPGLIYRFAEFVLDKARKHGRLPLEKREKFRNKIVAEAQRMVPVGTKIKKTDGYAEIQFLRGKPTDRILKMEVIDSHDTLPSLAHYVPLPDDPEKHLPVFYVQIQARAILAGLLPAVMRHEIIETEWRAIGASEAHADEKARHGIRVGDERLGPKQLSLSSYSPGMHHDGQKPVDGARGIFMRRLGIRALSEIAADKLFQKIAESANLDVKIAAHLFVTWIYGQPLPKAIAHPETLWMRFAYYAISRFQTYGPLHSDQQKDLRRKLDDFVQRNVPKSAMVTPHEDLLEVRFRRGDDTQRILQIDIIDSPDGQESFGHYMPLGQEKGSRLPLYRVYIQARAISSGRLDDVWTYIVRATEWRAVGASEQLADRMARLRKGVSSSTHSMIDRDLAPYSPGMHLAQPAAVPSQPAIGGAMRDSGGEVSADDYYRIVKPAIEWAKVNNYLRHLSGEDPLYSELDPSDREGEPGVLELNEVAVVIVDQFSKTMARISKERGISFTSDIVSYAVGETIYIDKARLPYILEKPEAWKRAWAIHEVTQLAFPSESEEDVQHRAPLPDQIPPFQSYVHERLYYLLRHMWKSGYDIGLIAKRVQIENKFEPLRVYDVFDGVNMPTDVAEYLFKLVSEIRSGIRSRSGEILNTLGANPSAGDDIPNLQELEPDSSYWIEMDTGKTDEQERPDRVQLFFDYLIQQRGTLMLAARLALDQPFNIIVTPDPRYVGMAFDVIVKRPSVVIPEGLIPLFPIQFPGFAEYIVDYAGSFLPRTVKDVPDANGKWAGAHRLMTIAFWFSLLAFSQYDRFFNNAHNDHPLQHAA